MLATIHYVAAGTDASNPMSLVAIGVATAAIVHAVRPPDAGGAGPRWRPDPGVAVTDDGPGAPAVVRRRVRPPVPRSTEDRLARLAARRSEAVGRAVSRRPAVTRWPRAARTDQSDGMPSAFQRDTAVTPDAVDPGRYRAHLPEDVVARRTCRGAGSRSPSRARAMQDAVPGHMPLRSVSCVFASPVEAGDVEIDVTLLRTGRTIAQVLATARTPGPRRRPHRDRRVRCAASRLRVHRRGDARVPAGRLAAVVPRPAARRHRLRVRRRSVPALGATTSRASRSPGTRRGSTTSRPAASAMTYQRFDETPQLDDGTVDPLALVALCDMMPGAVAERMGLPIEHDWYGPSADITVHVVGTARSEWLLARNRARRAADGYASLEVELWDPVTGLVAYGTQTMIFTFFGPHARGRRAVPPRSAARSIPGVVDVPVVLRAPARPRPDAARPTGRRPRRRGSTCWPSRRDRSATSTARTASSSRRRRCTRATGSGCPTTSSPPTSAR